MYWKAYWRIVNKLAFVVRDVLITLEKETKEKEKIVGNKQKLKKNDADKLEMQKAKKHDKLKPKRRRIMKSPTQSPLPHSPDSGFKLSRQNIPFLIMQIVITYLNDMSRLTDHMLK